MIRDHIAKCAGGFIEPRAALDTDGFGDSDLNVVDMLTIPERLENTVRKSHQHDVLNGFFAEEVVHPINLSLGHTLAQLAVERFGGLQIVAERLLHHDTTPTVRAFRDQACSAELVDDPRKKPSCDRKVEHDMLACAFSDRIGL